MPLDLSNVSTSLLSHATRKKNLVYKFNVMKFYPDTYSIYQFILYKKTQLKSFAKLKTENTGVRVILIQIS